MYPFSDPDFRLRADNSRCTYGSRIFCAREGIGNVGGEVSPNEELEFLMVPLSSPMATLRSLQIVSARSYRLFSGDTLFE